MDLKGLDRRIDILTELGNRLNDSNNEKVELGIIKAHRENQWFTPENSRKALHAICNQYLKKENLKSWVAEYDIDKTNRKNVGLVLAGNLPLVGIHDVISSFIAGHKSTIKASSKDKALIEMIVNEMLDIDSTLKEHFEITERLQNFDAVIATGSNNTAKHFEYYFKEYPSIIRKNRTSVAILDGSETKNDLSELGTDVFEYFGLGCRNVSKIYLPEGYNTDKIFEAFFQFEPIIHHNKYKNNYDYNEAIWLLAQDKFLTNGFIMLKEEESIYSRIASLHYEYYDDFKTITHKLSDQKDQIQCVSSNMKIKGVETIRIGQCQCPTLFDYADGVDTMEFLMNL